MCGRMTQQTPMSDVARIFDADVRDDEPVPARFNCAPTDPLNVVVQRDDGRVVERYRWGLIPAWSSDPRDGARMINARAETVATSPAFRIAFQRRRCLIPADGFYEWQRRDRQRLPWYLHLTDGAPMAMAGIWSLWRDPATGGWVPSCSVVTTWASEQVEPLHDRMPVILPRDAWWPWLDPAEPDLAFLQSLLTPLPDGALELYPVSTLVNSVRNDGPELVVPVVRPTTVAEEHPTLFG
jgi:putative SOS response-associated peptidase YedK